MPVSRMWERLVLPQGHVLLALARSQEPTGSPKPISLLAAFLKRAQTVPVPLASSSQDVQELQQEPVPPAPTQTPPRPTAPRAAGLETATSLDATTLVLLASTRPDAESTPFHSRVSRAQTQSQTSPTMSLQEATPLPPVGRHCAQHAQSETGKRGVVRHHQAHATCAQTQYRIFLINSNFPFLFCLNS